MHQTSSSSEKEAVRITHEAFSSVLLADDHTLLLEAFRSLLEPEFEIVVRSRGRNGAQLYRGCVVEPGDIILLDISMPLLNVAIEAARRLRKPKSHFKVIFLTIYANPTYVSDAMREGCQRLTAEMLGRPGPNRF